MSARLYPGRVVRARINPADCMGVADVINKLGLTPQRFTFDQAVRIALSSLLESARQNGAIPRRDGFEFNSLMTQFQPRPQDQARHLEIAKLVNTVEHVQLAVAPVTSVEMRRAKTRYDELQLKMRHASESMTAEDIEEFNRLQPMLVNQDFE